MKHHREKRKTGRYNTALGLRIYVNQYGWYISSWIDVEMNIDPGGYFVFMFYDGTVCKMSVYEI